MRRRRSSRLGKKLPVRTLGISRSRSPASVVSTFSRCPLRTVVRVGVCSIHSAPMWALASASINSCTIRSAMARMSSIPSVERSDSRSRISSDRDRAIVHSSWLNWAFTKESYAMARLLLRERSPPVEVRPGQTPAHSQPLIPYTTTRDTIGTGSRCRRSS